MPSAISVIMSVFNGEDYLKESIDSILTQTFRDFEFIIVDDASQDHSRDILKAKARQDPRIKILLNPHNLGLTRSLNLALEKAQGRYIARQDADDVSSPGRLALQRSYLESNPAIFLIGTSALIVDDQGQIQKKYCRDDNPGKWARKLRRYNPLFHSSIMFRNQKLRYRHKFYFAQDYDLYLRLLTQGKKISNLPPYLIQHRITSQTITQVQKKAQKRFAQVAKKFYRQRCKTGQDDYPHFNPQIILQND